MGACQTMKCMGPTISTRAAAVTELHLALRLFIASPTTLLVQSRRRRTSTVRTTYVPADSCAHLQRQSAGR